MHSPCFSSSSSHARKAISSPWAAELGGRGACQTATAGFEQFSLAIASIENDIRARVKKDINLALGSSYVEEKSYQDYGAGQGAA